MKSIIQTALRACILVALGAGLTGCIIVPVPFGHGGGHDHYHDRH